MLLVDAFFNHIFFSSAKIVDFKLFSVGRENTISIVTLSSGFNTERLTSQLSIGAFLKFRVALQCLFDIFQTTVPYDY